MSAVTNCTSSTSLLFLPNDVLRLILSSYIFDPDTLFLCFWTCAKFQRLLRASKFTPLTLKAFIRRSTVRGRLSFLQLSYSKLLPNARKMIRLHSWMPALAALQGHLDVVRWETTQLES